MIVGFGLGWEAWISQILYTVIIKFNIGDIYSMFCFVDLLKRTSWQNFNLAKILTFSTCASVLCLAEAQFLLWATPTYSYEALPIYQLEYHSLHESRVSMQPCLHIRYKF